MDLVESSGYRFAFVAYCIFMLTVFNPYIFGEIVAPYRQSAEIGAADANPKSTHIENRHFGDYNNGFIPEISEHLNGLRSGWLTLWTSKTELGRPMYQISGFSPAYLPSWIIGQLTDSPWRFITVLSLVTCFLAGAFVLLFCREIGLSPFSGLIAGTSLAASPLFMYWLTFPMFPSVWCWSAGALWAVTRLAKKPDILGWSALAFSGHSLLMTAYPQVVVFHAYLLGGYAIYLAHCKQQLAPCESARFLVLAASALFVGATLTLPVYLDLANIYTDSARVAPDSSFFTVVLPQIASFAEAVRFFVLGTIPELFGNPVTPNFPLAYDGLSVTLLVIFFATVGLLAALKQTWGWWLAIVVLCLLTFVHPLYVLGIKYLGFNLSRSIPLGSIMLPLTVIVAYGVEALIKRAEPQKISKATMAAAACVLAVIAVGLAYGLTQAVPIRWGVVQIMLLLVGLLAAQYRKTRPVLLITALAIVLVVISYPLMLRQDPEHMATTSPLVEKVRANLPVGSRFAVVAPGISTLPPNLNAALGLASVHSYNSLSSRRYHTLINALGGEVQTYGRWNSTISPDYASAMFWMSNISLLLSPTNIMHENLEFLGEVSGIHLYKVISRMGDSLQVTLPPQASTSADGLHIADPRLLLRHSPIKLLDEGDVLEFEVQPGASSVLILSQKYHRDWQGRVLVRQGWEPTQTTVINGVFQGVLLPSDANRVRLEFKPFVRYAWIAHVFWLLLIVLLSFRAWQKNQNAGLVEV